MARFLVSVWPDFSFAGFSGWLVLPLSFCLAGLPVGLARASRALGVAAKRALALARAMVKIIDMTLSGISTFIRKDGRATDQLRPVTIRRHYLKHGEGNVLVTFGDTTVLCVASFTQGVPRWRKDSGLGWVTGEYSMLPRATDTRNQRESVAGKVGGRTQEISRLLGRSLRAVVDLSALGENTIVLDCDVLQADGGTRTASITGAYVALADALTWGIERGFVTPRVDKPVLRDSVSAISVGIIDGVPCLDLPYEEDSRAETDMNVVMTGSGAFIEVQGTAEGEPFNRGELEDLLDLAASGNAELARLQREALSE